MNKNISTALVALVAFTGMTASAQVGINTNVEASASTTSMSGEAATGASTGATITEKRQHGSLPIRSDVRLEMEAREKARNASTTTPRQTQGATFGEKSKGSAIGDPDFDLLKKMRVDTRAQVAGERKDMRIEMEGNRIKMETRAREIHASTTAQHEKIKDQAQKKRLEMARKQVEIVDDRLLKAIERVQKLSNRVAERLTKLEATGVDVTVARGHLAIAKAKLDEARVKAAGVSLVVEMSFASITASITASTTAGVPASTTPAQTAQGAMKSIQEAVKDVAKTIQEAHNHVALAISSIKPGINKGQPATTSTTVTGTVSATTTQ